MSLLCYIYHISSSFTTHNQDHTWRWTWRCSPCALTQSWTTALLAFGVDFWLAGRFLRLLDTQGGSWKWWSWNANSDDHNCCFSQSAYQEMPTLMMIIALLRPHRETPDLVWWRSAGLERLTLVDVRFCSIHMVWCVAQIYVAGLLSGSSAKLLERKSICSIFNLQQHLILNKLWDIACNNTPEYRLKGRLYRDGWLKISTIGHLAESYDCRLLPIDMTASCKI